MIKDRYTWLEIQKMETIDFLGICEPLFIFFLSIIL